MANYIKVNGSWTTVQKNYKKINNVWNQENDLITALGNSIYQYKGNLGTITIIGETQYVGKSFLLSATYEGMTVYPTWSITSGNANATINTNGKVTINAGVTAQQITVQASYQGKTDTKTITITYDNELTIECQNVIIGRAGNIIARYNSTVVTPTWSITNGSSYATIANDGSLTILNDGSITISATYGGYTTTRTVDVIYEVDTISSTSVNEQGAVITGTTNTTTDIETGAVTTTTETTIVNEDGSSSTTETEVIKNQDGSSSTTSSTSNSNGTSSETTSTTSAPDQAGSIVTETTTTNYDGNGDVSSSTENETILYSNGSSESTTINYDENGDAVNRTNENTDTSGNINTQDIIYDENGNEVITGYSIDTTDNPNGTKNYNAEGVDTEYYAFDLTHGFVLDFNFTIDFSNQPPNQNQNHHNVLTMKRADPEPWYGFQLRQSGTNKYIQLGTQFSTGSNTNTRIDPTILNGNVAEYNLRITYDPTVSTNTFVCRDLTANTDVYTSNLTFPDLQELKYLSVVIGYSVDANGDPYRYSNINVKNFELRRLVNIEEPVITCNNNVVAITCATAGASIYYRIGTSGDFSRYTNTFTISANTTVQAYGQLDNDVSEIVTQNCIYDNGIESPVIYCDGQFVTISCDTPSVDIYYRIGTSGNFSLYEEAIEISADTTIQAYASLNGEVSQTVTENCTYIAAIAQPVITCDGVNVTITCATSGTTIYYKVDSGSFTQYSAPFAINDDVVVQAYAMLGGRMSTTAIESCTYNPVHDYSQDYLTFKIITSGNIVWKAMGSGATKTIEYSIDNGSWTSITSTSGGVSIPVSVNQSVRFRGSNTRYCEANKSNYSAFYEGTATYNAEGNIMSLIYGDNFVGQTTLGGVAWALSNVFNHSQMVSAENLVMPATTLSNDCYRATFANSPLLTIPPELPATTLATECYYYMFDNCASLTRIPDLLATTLTSKCYLGMFHCESVRTINYIRCLATPNTTHTQNWIQLSSGSNCSVAASGTFVKAPGTNWITGVSGIPTGWIVVEDGVTLVDEPVISCDGEHVTITCATTGADIYYRIGTSGSYSQYTSAITISANATVQAYGELNGQPSTTVTQNCEYVSSVPIEESNRNLESWTYNGNVVTTPYSVNAIDGHSSAYNKGTFNFETSFTLRTAHPTYLWFQHADQSATVYIDNTLVEKHWGGYNSFFVDISNNVHTGTNNLKVALKNNEGNYLAPAAGDFNYNATLGNVRLLTSPVLPEIQYGYDGFHITATNVSQSSATLNVKTTVPNGASVVCTIDDNDTNSPYHYTNTQNSVGNELTFTTTITNPHLWNGVSDPHMYSVTIEIYYNNEIYHRFQRDYGIRYYEYLINDTTKIGTVANPFTGFTLNGSPYYLRGVCMHHDKDQKANALTASDIASDFGIIQELGCNFIRLAHYPHPKEVYDWCDRLGIIVQTEVPCVNKMQSTMPSDYFTHLTTQYTEMVNEHFNHPCILFWGLSNETTTDDKAFAKTKIEDYTTLIKNLDSERLVGYVMSHNYDDPYGYYNSPAGIDWLGCNLYVGWYIDQNSNNPTDRINTRITKTITNKNKPLALSEYGCGGTQHCHSTDFMTTTTRGNNARHDIEYMMWLHEGHIATIKQYPQLMFTAQWQLFDIAVANRNEGYTVCLDGENTSIDDELRRLNDKGLVERDHVTKKDPFYLYKAWWNPTPFVHICQKDYTKMTSRVIKCYTNQTSAFDLKVNGTTIETVTPTDNILTFTAYTFSAGDVVSVEGSGNISDTFTFAS